MKIKRAVQVDSVFTLIILATCKDQFIAEVISKWDSLPNLGSQALYGLGLIYILTALVIGAFFPMIFDE
jgi:hypothetical protein